jgi:hypothetical protein
MTTITNQREWDATARRAAIKLQGFLDGLTAEEQAALDRAARRHIAGDAADTEGYRAAEYEDAFGWKGRPGTGGESTPPQGGAGGALPVVVLTTLPLIILGGGGYQAPGEYPR